MKATLSVVTATIVPFGLVVLAIAFLGHLLVKRRQERAARLQTPSPAFRRVPDDIPAPGPY